MTYVLSEMLISVNSLFTIIIILNKSSKPVDKCNSNSLKPIISSVRTGPGLGTDHSGPTSLQFSIGTFF